MLAPPTPWLVVGKESVGKSRLIAGLTGRGGSSANFPGTTVAIHRYDGNGQAFIDTPGIERHADNETTRMVIARLAFDEPLLLVVKATHLDEDLADLLPLAHGRPAAVAVTFWDRVAATPGAAAALGRLAAATGLPFVAVDARRIDGEDRARVAAALARAAPAPADTGGVLAGWRIEPRPTMLEHRCAGPILAALLLLLPSLASVWCAGALAGFIEPAIKAVLKPAIDAAKGLPGPVAAVLAGDYGLLSMGPLLLIWALPTVALFAIFLGVYRVTGLLDRLSAALHPFTWRLGLTGRDVARVVMGFGCNVPAVIGTRACSTCSRGPTVQAIAFGSACSYQLGATLAVFAAAGRPSLAWPYLAILVVATLTYARLTVPRTARAGGDILLVERRAFLTAPEPRALWREVRGTLAAFLSQALPIFVVMAVAASLAAWAGVTGGLAAAVEPLLRAVALPGEVAVPTVFATLRKDGILLFAEGGTLDNLDAWELLVAVYLAGVLLPCLVTALTVARELSARFALGMLGRQAAFAIASTALLGWTGAACVRIAALT